MVDALVALATAAAIFGGPVSMLIIAIRDCRRRSRVAWPRR